MNPNINLIPSAHLVKQQYLLWNPVDETWSDPVDFATAQETAARTPGLQACVLMPDGTTSTPAPMSEIIKRAAAHLPRATNQAAALPPETLALLTHALRLFLCVTYGILYIGAAGAIIGGLASGEKNLAIAGVIVAAATMILHEYLTRRAD